MIGTSDRPCWLAESGKIILLLTICLGRCYHNMPVPTCHAQVESVLALNTTCRPVLLHTWHRTPAHGMCRHVSCCHHFCLVKPGHKFDACLLFLSSSHYPPAQTSRQFCQALQTSAPLGTCPRSIIINNKNNNNALGFRDPIDQETFCATLPSCVGEVPHS